MLFSVSCLGLALSGLAALMYSLLSSRRPLMEVLSSTVLLALGLVLLVIYAQVGRIRLALSLRSGTERKNGSISDLTRSNSKKKKNDDDRDDDDNNNNKDDSNDQPAAHNRGRKEEVSPVDVVRRMANRDFVLPFTLSLRYCFFRVAAVPHLASAFVEGGAIASKESLQATVNTVDLLLAVAVEDAQPQAVADRVVALLASYGIDSRDDLQYLVCLVLYEPLVWMRAFGERAVLDEEAQAWATFWLDFGRMMGLVNLPPPIPSGLAYLEAWCSTYESSYFVRSWQHAGRHPQVGVVGGHLLDLYVASLPLYLRIPFGGPVLVGIMSDQVSVMLSFESHRLASSLLYVLLTVSATMSSILWPPRTTFVHKILASRRQPTHPLSALPPLGYYSGLPGGAPLRQDGRVDLSLVGVLRG